MHEDTRNSSRRQNPSLRSPSGGRDPPHCGGDNIVIIFNIITTFIVIVSASLSYATSRTLVDSLVYHLNHASMYSITIAMMIVVPMCE
jgi:hypothetical protein